ncbi:hypothetical protein BHM03_00021714 [Ensete ventricosum]|nr:hypothetical protein BHM03_00021714 [Ensete ventricosum]
MSKSSIHPHLIKVIGGRQSIMGSKHNSFYHFLQRFTLSYKHQSTKDMSNKISLYRKHMWNNKIYMCQYEIL